MGGMQGIGRSAAPKSLELRVEALDVVSPELLSEMKAIFGSRFNGKNLKGGMSEADWQQILAMKAVAAQGLGRVLAQLRSVDSPIDLGPLTLEMMVHASRLLGTAAVNESDQRRSDAVSAQSALQSLASRQFGSDALDRVHSAFREARIEALRLKGKEAWSSP